MSVLTEKVMTRDWARPGQNTLAVYQQHGGYQQLKKALEGPCTCSKSHSTRAPQTRLS